MRPAAELVSQSASPAAGDGPEDPHRHRHPLAVAVGLLVAAALIVLDQATKQLAEQLLDRGEFVPWLGPRVGWQLVYNPGAAFGIPAPIWLPLTVTVVVVVIVARALPRTPTLLPAVSYGLLLAGAIGNVLDRLFRAGDGDGFGSGEVVDFVAWGSFPRFNVADSAITVGFLLLVVALWQEERGARDERWTTPQPADGPDASVGGPDASVGGSDPSVDGTDPSVSGSPEPTPSDDRHDDRRDEL